MRSADAYLGQLQALLPEGAAWPREEGAVLTQLLHAFADGLARSDGRADSLLDEADPLTTLEMLPDWERAVGLPDRCVGTAGSVRERQLAITRRIAGAGGQSIPFLVDLAAQLGLEVEIDEFAPFAIGDRVGKPIYDSSWRFAFRVRALPPSESAGDPIALRFAFFRSGEARVGERLLSVGSASLECVISRARPAHSEVIYAYPQDPEPAFWFDFLQAA